MKFIKAKAEKAGNYINLMGLHYEPKKIHIEELKELCRNARTFMEDGCMFYYLVVFDSEESAVFPETPFTAMFGAEEEPRKHIKAIYCYNRMNGYSALQMFEKNAWESVAVEYKI